MSRTKVALAVGLILGVVTDITGTFQVAVICMIIAVVVYILTVRIVSALRPTKDGKT